MPLHGSHAYIRPGRSIDKKLRRAKFILDIKGEGVSDIQRRATYWSVMRKISATLDQFPGSYGMFIPQVYSEEDMQIAREKPFFSYFLAVWKWHLGDGEILRLVDTYPEIGVVTLFYNRMNPDLADNLIQRAVVPVVHGRVSYAGLAAGVGCFTYHPEMACQHSGNSSAATGPGPFF